MTGFESFIGLNPWTALFTLCNMVISFLVLKKFLFQPVKKMIDDRQKEIDDMYADADAARTEAKHLEQAYQQQLSGAKQESADIVRQASATAQQRSEEILRQAMDEASAVKQKAMGDIALEKKRAMNDIKDDISGMALEIAEKMVGREINAADQQSLIEEFLREMGEQQ